MDNTAVSANPLSLRKLRRPNRTSRPRLVNMVNWTGTEAERLGPGFASDSDARGIAIVMKVGRTDVNRLWPNEPAVAQLFEAMSRPAEDPADSERRREQCGRKLQTVQQKGRVELDVGVEPALGLALVQQAERGRLDRAREIVERTVAVGRVEVFGRPREHVGAGIADAVDAMSESHQPLAAIEPAADDRFGAI